MRSAVFVTENPAEQDLFLRCTSRFYPAPTVQNRCTPNLLDIGRVNPQSVWPDIGTARCRAMADTIGAPTIMIQRSLHVEALGLGVYFSYDPMLCVDPVRYVKAVGANNLVTMLNANGDTRASLVHRVHFVNPATRMATEKILEVPGHIGHTGNPETFDIVDTIFRPEDSFMNRIPWDSLQMRPDPSAAPRVYVFNEIAYNLPSWM